MMNLKPAKTFGKHVVYARMVKLAEQEYQSGRSMVEMLGTLAIMGIVALAGMWAYNAGMDQLKANTLINEAQKRAVIVAGQINMLNRSDPSLGEFSDNTFGGGTFETNVTVNGLYQQFGIHVSNVPKRVCQNILNAVGDSIAIRRLAHTTSPTESMTTCMENNDFLMIYNNDLSTSSGDTEYAQEVCGCQTVCGTCITENDVARCVNECPATGTCSATQPCSGDCVGCVIPEGETTGTCQACQRVEYLEATGNQYIDTGYYVQGMTDRIDADFQFTSVAQVQQRVFGNYQASGSLYSHLYINQNGNFAYNFSNGTYWIATTIPANTKRYRASLDGQNGKFSLNSLDGSDVYNRNLTYKHDNTATGSLLLFAFNNASGASYLSHEKIYSIKIYRNGKTLFDFIPVHAPFQPSNKQNCIYDKVSKALFCNAASGDDFTIPAL